MAAPAILVFNGGSSSIRFAVLDADDALACRQRGRVERVGHADAHLALRGAGGVERVPIAARDPAEAARSLLAWLDTQGAGRPLAGAAHRVVHGLQHVEPERVTPALLEHLRSLCPLDPDHLPVEIALIEAVGRERPALPQVACFDTQFHRDLPAVAARLPIPRRFADLGVRRYGFHGLSYTWLMEALARDAGADAARGRVVLAHLGSGASMAAVHAGRCVDTTMGFTPTAGLVMGTRPGDLDAGLAPWLQRSTGLDSAGFEAMINRESGLLGVSGSSADVRELLAAEDGDPRAAEAVALFCHAARKALGALAAVLGGLDTLVFAGGIGENLPVARARICAGLGFLGIALDDARNAANAPLVSRADARVAVRVIPTDEETVIARAARDLLHREGGA